MAAGDWAALTLTDATLKGLAAVDLEDGNFFEFDTDRKQTDMLTAARSYIESRLVGALPELIRSAEGPAAFMDAATTISNVSGLIQQLYGLAFLRVYYRQERYSTSGLFQAKIDEISMDFEDAFTSFVKYMPKDEDFIDALEVTADRDLSRFGKVIWVG